MSRIPVKFVELHSDMFIYSEKGGRNLKSKLKVADHRGMMMEYDYEADRVHVWLDGMYGHAGPTANVAPFEVPAPECQHPGVIPPKVVGDTTQRNPPASAQVSTPYGHVHAGPGAGQTGQEEAIKRGPGRPKGS